jgi:hypothetical protein
MLRLGLILVALSLALASPAGAAPGHPKVKLLACNQDANSASFRGSMWAHGKAKTLEMRFALQTRSKAAPHWAHSVPPEGFDVWSRANPGVTHYISDQNVLGLVDGSSYRVLVRFRWRNAKGKVVATDSRLSKTCRQPDPRPNLKVRKVGVRATGDPSTRTYLVRIANRGASDAGIFSSALQVNGLDQPQQATATTLSAGTETVVEFTAPRCRPGSALVATADTGAQVDESDETDNTLTVDCPVGGRNG